jgi:hypothetical protein
MEKEFVPYELAFKMKQLGFDEPCFGRYYYKESYPMLNPNSGETELVFEFGQYIKQTEITILAPLYQQAFRWFRENYNLFCEINVDKTMEPKFAFTIKEYESAQFLEGFGEDVLSEYLYYKHEEAEVACLEKLIEIVEQKEK